MLLTERMSATLPRLYACEHDADPLMQVTFFLPGTRWTWYGIEFDGEDTLFGYVRSGLDPAFAHVSGVIKKVTYFFR